MARSQNGYTVPTTLAAQHALLVDVPVEGGTLRVRKGDTATLFADLFAQLAELEKPQWPGCWSFYVRPIRGQTTGYSNHSSGTAIDFNAPQHPRQSFDRHRGWTDGQVDRIHHLLADRYEHVIRWGGDYNAPGPYDPMHFEVNATPAALAKVAAKIRAGQKGTTVTTVKTKFTKTQALPADGTMATLHVKDGTSNVSYIADDPACSVDGVIWVYGTGPAGTEVTVDGIFSKPDGKGGWETDIGIGKDSLLIGPDGTFTHVYPVRGDKPKGDRARVQAGARGGVKVTTVRVNVKKG